MNPAISTEQWRAVESTQVLEKRTYESGQVRWYSKGHYRWYRTEKSMALHWLEKKVFVKADEYDDIKKKEAEMMALRFFLIQAQKLSPTWKPKWERK